MLGELLTVTNVQRINEFNNALRRLQMVKYCFQRDKKSQDCQKSPYILDAGADVSVFISTQIP